MPFRPEIQTSSASDTSSYLDAPPSIAEQFILEERRNPELARQVSEAAWAKLNADEQDRITVLAAHAFPEDIEAREKAIRLHLIETYITGYIQEVQAYANLEADHSAPDISHPHNDYML